MSVLDRSFLIALVLALLSAFSDLLYNKDAARMADFTFNNQMECNALSADYKFKWLIKISPFGRIKFNTEAYPQLTATEFAKKFIEITEATRLQNTIITPNDTRQWVPNLNPGGCL